MRWQIIFATVSLAACLDISAPQAGKSDQDAIQGVWQVVGGESEGKAMPPELSKGWQVTFKGNSIIQKIAKEEDTGSFILDSTKKPKHLDITLKTRTEKEAKTYKCIYELSGDDLKISIPDQGSDRPTDFKTQENSQFGVVIYKREKK